MSTKSTKTTSPRKRSRLRTRIQQHDPNGTNLAAVEANVKTARSTTRYWRLGRALELISSKSFSTPNAASTQFPKKSHLHDGHAGK